MTERERLDITIEVLREHAELNRKSSETWRRARAGAFYKTANWLSQIYTAPSE